MSNEKALLIQSITREICGLADPDTRAPVAAGALQLGLGDALGALPAHKLHAVVATLEGYAESARLERLRGPGE